MQAPATSVRINNDNGPSSSDRARILLDGVANESNASVELLLTCEVNWSGCRLGLALGIGAACG